MSHSEIYSVLALSARSVALLLDVGFQKQSRVFFHPLSNDASTGMLLYFFVRNLRLLVINGYFWSCMVMSLF